MAIRIDTQGLLTGSIESLIGGRSENQDAAGYREVPLGSIIVVCDGMGGGNGGSTASHLAVQTIIDDVAGASKEEDRKEVLGNAIIHANEVIIKTGNEDSTLKGMGTTVVAAIISEQSLIVAHVGDSRLYQLRGRNKVFRTWDHSLVFQMVASGLITEEDARNHPQSNVILSGLGIFETIEPTITELSYNKGDRFVLCTDGFWGAMPEKNLLKLLSGRGDLQETLENAALEVNSIGVRKGGTHDNLTAIAFDVNQNSKLKPKMRNSIKIILATLIVLLFASISLNVLTFKQIIQVDDFFKTKESTIGTDSLSTEAPTPKEDSINLNTSEL